MEPAVLGKALSRLEEVEIYGLHKTDREQISVILRNVASEGSPLKRLLLDGLDRKVFNLVEQDLFRRDRGKVGQFLVLYEGDSNSE